MRTYQVFGGALRSDIDFPELRTHRERRAELDAAHHVARACDWHPPACSASAEVIPGSSSSCFATRTASVSSSTTRGFSTSPTVDATSPGAPVPHFEDSWVRADVTGRVMAVALHASGHLCLHGSAVATGGGAIAFLAPKFHGKSTLALALARAGREAAHRRRVPVDPRPPVQAVPGVHQVKLWQDSASHFGVDRETETPRPGSKHLLHDFDDNMLSNERAPLAADLSPLAGDGRGGRDRAAGRRARACTPCPPRSRWCVTRSWGAC